VSGPQPAAPGRVGPGTPLSGSGLDVPGFTLDGGRTSRERLLVRPYRGKRQVHGRPTLRAMGTDEHACPACGQPVATVVHRYKTLGAWVPRWGPGPCRNLKCEAYADEPGPGRRPPQEPAAGNPEAPAADV
jgi:hypothetical protein